MHKKLLLVLVLVFILCIGIIVKILFSGNTVYLSEINDGKTTYAHVGATVVVSLSSPVYAVYLSNNTVIRPTSGLTEVFPAAPPTPYAYGITHKEMALFASYL
jgi:hypothetical protein